MFNVNLLMFNVYILDVSYDIRPCPRTRAFEITWLAHDLILLRQQTGFQTFKGRYLANTISLRYVSSIAILTNVQIFESISM